ncbi:MAG: hypothetical protein N2116_03565 [Armatimonadetes bacterium]|nr:hypothetical protein [Armatimonadota bacterium]
MRWEERCVDCSFPQAEYFYFSIQDSYIFRVSCPMCELNLCVLKSDFRRALCPLCKGLSVKQVSWVGGKGWVSYYVCTDCNYVFPENLQRLVDLMHERAAKMTRLEVN